MAYRKVDESSLTQVANAIRNKAGTSAKLNFPTGFANAIAAIPTGGGGITPTGTITITENGMHYVANYENANVALPEVEQATPSISVSSSGLITASVTQEAGVVPAGTETATKQLTTQSAKTVTPGISNQTAVSSGRYTTGTVTVKGDANLVAGNIKKDVRIFGVTGSYEGTSSGGIDTSDATATAADIASGKTAYVGGHKITGSVTSYDSQTGWNNVTPVVSGDNLRLSRDTNIPYLFRKGFYLGTPLSNLGDASASDVAKGKTFTSASGLKLTGTFEGGGLPDGFTAFASDTVTFANASYGPTIEHGLGVVPNFFYVVAEGSPTKADFTNYLIAHLAVKQTLEGNSGYYVTLSVSSAGVTLANTQVIKANDISNYFNETTIMPYGFFKQGKTYRWAAGVMDGIA